jgi:hypothetical protein
MKKREYYGGGRKPTGTLVRNRRGYSAEIWITKDGERVRITKSLGTDSKAVARKKLARLLIESDPMAFDAAAPETFEDAALRVYAERQSVRLKDEISRVERFALPVLGPLRANAVAPRHINEVLGACKAAGKSRQTCQHLARYF